MDYRDRSTHKVPLIVARSTDRRNGDVLSGNLLTFLPEVKLADLVMAMRSEICVCLALRVSPTGNFKVGRCRLQKAIALLS